MKSTKQKKSPVRALTFPTLMYSKSGDFVILATGGTVLDGISGTIVEAGLRYPLGEYRKAWLAMEQFSGTVLLEES